MNTLPRYPEFPDTFWSFKHALSSAGKRASMPPLGLATVAALRPADGSLRLVDTNVRALTDRDLAWADGAFVSAMVEAGFDHDRPTVFQTIFPGRSP